MQLVLYLCPRYLIKNDLQRKIPLGNKRVKLHEHIKTMFELRDWNPEQLMILRYFAVLPSVDISLEHLKKLFNVEDENEFENNLVDLFRFGLLTGELDSHFRNL